MKNLVTAVGLVALVSLAGGLARGDDKKGDDKKVDKAKLVGVWKETGPNATPALVEFTADGKLIIWEEKEKKKVLEGSYTLDGNKLSTSLKIADVEQKDSDTIKSLTDDKMTLVDKNGKENNFERAKK